MSKIALSSVNKEILNHQFIWVFGLYQKVGLLEDLISVFTQRGVFFTTRLFKIFVLMHVYGIILVIIHELI